MAFPATGRHYRFHAPTLLALGGLLLTLGCSHRLNTHTSTDLIAAIRSGMPLSQAEAILGPPATITGTGGAGQERVYQLDESTAVRIWYSYRDSLRDRERSVGRYEVLVLPVADPAAATSGRAATMPNELDRARDSENRLPQTDNAEAGAESFTKLPTLVDLSEDPPTLDELIESLHGELGESIDTFGSEHHWVMIYESTLGGYEVVLSGGFNKHRHLVVRRLVRREPVLD